MCVLVGEVCIACNHHCITTSTNDMCCQLFEASMQTFGEKLETFVDNWHVVESSGACGTILPLYKWNLYDAETIDQVRKYILR